MRHYWRPEKPYRPRLGGIHDRILQHFKKNPGATFDETMQIFGSEESKKANQAYFNLVRAGLVPKIDRIHNPSAPAIVKVLLETIWTNRQIADKFGVSVSTIQNIANQCRSKLMRRSITSNSGLKFEKLETPHAQLGVEQKKAIIEANIAPIEEMLAPFRRKPAEAKVRRRVNAYINMALGKYHPDIMPQRPFVLLAVKRALYGHMIESAKAAGIRQSRPRSRQKRKRENPFAAEAGKFVESALPQIESIARRQGYGDDIVHGAVELILEKFHPDIEFKGRFVREQLSRAAQKYFGPQKSEKIKALALAAQMKSEIPELQNRPKHTT